MSSTLSEILYTLPAEGVPLEALAELVNRALADAQVSVDDKRAAERLDGRTIRFYQSLAILPKPSSYQGRRAFYGREHLIRAVAAKQLQSEGYSLAQIQSALPAQSCDELLSALAETLRGVTPPSIEPRKSAPHAVDPRGAPLTSRPLITHQIAPGVMVTIDPAIVADPSVLLSSITRSVADARDASEGSRRHLSRE